MLSTHATPSFRPVMRTEPAHEVPCPAERADRQGPLAASRPLSMRKPSLLRQLKDVLLMAVGRDDDEDYECARG